MPKFKSFANEKFWKNYADLPKEIQHLADKAFELFKTNPQHISLHFKKVGKKQPIYSVRITDHYRSLGYLENDSVYWFWIGDHTSYEKLIKSI
jgi:mRNA-degrading endonuclease RelE of RelBE toxin-antitoxin system